MSEFRDHAGKLLGFTRKSFGESDEGVYAHGGAFLGSFDEDSTRAQSGARLGSNKNFGLLNNDKKQP